MKKILFTSLLLVSFSGFASKSSSEPKVNFSGVQVGITKTCLSADGLKLITKKPVKLYALVNRGGRTVSTYVESKILETGINYTVKGKCLRRTVRGSCIEHAPSEAKTYQLSGNFEVSKYRTIAGRIRIKTSTEVVNYNVDYCL